MALSELLKIVTPPEKPNEVPANPDWESIEQKLGVQLPNDYKRYVTVFGTGVLGNFVRVYNPFSKREFTNLLKSTKRVCEIQKHFKETESNAVPFEIYPDSPGLLPWGNDDNGNRLFWLTKGARNKWPVVACAGRDFRYQQFDMGMTTFLAKSLKKELKCKIWPKDFPEIPEDYVFEPY